MEPRTVHRASAIAVGVSRGTARRQPPAAAHVGPTSECELVCIELTPKQKNRLNLCEIIASSNCLSGGWAAAVPSAAPWAARHRRPAPRLAAATSGSSCSSRRHSGAHRASIHLGPLGLQRGCTASCRAPKCTTGRPARAPSSRPHQKKTAPRKLGGVSQPSARPLRSSLSVTSGSMPSSPVAWLMVVTLHRSQGLTLRTGCRGECQHHAHFVPTSCTPSPRLCRRWMAKVGVMPALCTCLET